MLYHVSFRPIRGGILYPRIPKYRGGISEDSQNKRICFSTTIEKAISAMPNGGKALLNMLEISKHFGLNPLLYVYCIGEDQIPSENLIPNNVVSKFVPDAGSTGEVWVVGQKVKCHKDVIEVTGVKTRQLIDEYGNEVIWVDSMQCQPYLELKYHSFYSIVSKNQFKTDVRKILAAISLQDLLGQPIPEKVK